MDELRYHTVASRPVPPAGPEIKLSRDETVLLRNFAVFPPFHNPEVFKYSQIFRDIF